MKIKFCGAAAGVTGSCHLLTTEDHMILLDCGQFQGGKAEEALNWGDFPFNPEEVECVVLSHAHIDHCGRLPLLAKRGFRGKIYCTDATADLLKVMLEDSGHIHEKDAEWQNKKNERAGKPLVEPLYTIKDAEKALELVQPVLYDQLVELNDKIRICFNDAGHILGSAIVELWVKEKDTETKIVFSGDLGMNQRPILKDPTIIKKADCVIMESTYGDRMHPENLNDVHKLIDIIISTKKRGGTTVIPSFAVGRTQELIYQLNGYYENSEYAKELKGLKVYVDSPMAVNATEVFQNNAQVFDEETKKFILKGDNPLEFPELHFVKDTKESQALNADKRPKVIISASGMCEAGRIRHHLKHNLWDARNSIVFVGYQAEGTLGRALINGQKDVALLGEPVHVAAEIHNLQGFSGHADQGGLLNWVGGFRVTPKQMFLVHGETDAKKTLAAKINERFGYNPVVVLGVSEYDIDTTTDEYTLTNFQEAAKAGADSDDILKVRSQVGRVHKYIEDILYNANLSLDGALSEEKLTKINNILQELEKATISLGTAVNAKEKLAEAEAE